MKSEYFLNLSKESKMRYQNKVVVAGLAQDPYSIQEWTESPDQI